MKPELELYLHIPFCARKCAYCDFFSGAFSDVQIKEYFSVLRAEIAERAENIAHAKETASAKEPALAQLAESRVRSIFIGGGTPSVVPVKELEKTVRLLYECFDISDSAEFTIEANPGTLDREKLAAYRAFGVNRLSLGLQSADDNMLRKLGRIHSYAAFLENYHAAREAGFANISVDLMSGLPGETSAQFENSLKTVLSLKPEHLSVYSLIIEENTPFYALYGENGKRKDELPPEETDRLIYHRTREIMEEAGLHRYEISNYAKPGYECIHNLGYWTGVPYLGFGAAAAGFDGKTRRKNASSLDYRILPPEEEETLDENDLMSEFMILGLRLTRGVPEEEFHRRFGKRPEEVFAEPLKRHCALGTIVREDGRIRLSEYGLDVANAVMADFLLT